MIGATDAGRILGFHLYSKLKSLVSRASQCLDTSERGREHRWSTWKEFHRGPQGFGSVLVVAFLFVCQAHHPVSCPEIGGKAERFVILLQGSIVLARPIKDGDKISKDDQG